MSKTIVFAAADTNYFIEHGKEFINSCVKHENYCFMTVFPNFEDDLDEQAKRLHEFRKSVKLHPNAGEYGLGVEFFQHMYNGHIVMPKAYYASFRFLHLPAIMQTFPNDNLLVLDVDSLIMTKLPEIQEEVGMYLRLNNQVGGNEYEVEGMKVAAGILYLKADQIDVAKNIKERILVNQMVWFNDQHAIYNAYKEIRTQKSIRDLNDGTWMDWNFEDGTYIWTAKGDRKSNPVYLEAKKSNS
jgi:hypothetical protein